MRDSALTLDLCQVNGSAVLIVEGDIDSHSVVELCAVLDNLDTDEQVIVDMAGVRFMDSSGLNALIKHTARIQGTTGSLRITNPSRPVARVVEITGMVKVLFNAGSRERSAVVSS